MRMSTQAFRTERRQFFGQLALSGVAIVLAPSAFAQAGAELKETDPTAAALGYKADSSLVDVARYPNHKPAQLCSNCNLIQGKVSDDLRPCAIFPGKTVRAKGWCAAYVASVS